MPRSELGRSGPLEEEQASLRRLAALVAAGAASTEVFTAVAREVARMLHPRLAQIYRWNGDGSATVVGTWGDGPNPYSQGSTWAWDDPSLVEVIDRMRSGRPIRIEDVAEGVAGEPAEAGISVGLGSAAAAPIMVDGEPWGRIGVGMARGAPLPDRVEERLAEITELVATAVNSSTNRERLVRLADEQAALRRVATLVARGAPPAEVFHAVAEGARAAAGRRLLGPHPLRGARPDARRPVEVLHDCRVSGGVFEPGEPGLVEPVDDVPGRAGGRRCRRSSANGASRRRRYRTAERRGAPARQVGSSAAHAAARTRGPAPRPPAVTAGRPSVPRGARTPAGAEKLDDLLEQEDA